MENSYSINRQLNQQDGFTNVCSNNSDIYTLYKLRLLIESFPSSLDNGQKYRTIKKFLIQ